MPSLNTLRWIILRRQDTWSKRYSLEPNVWQIFLDQEGFLQNYPIRYTGK